MGKIGPKFSHLLTVMAEGADPPLVSLTVKIPFFYDSSYYLACASSQLCAFISLMMWVGFVLYAQRRKR